jgi:hypothetical protein
LGDSALLTVLGQLAFMPTLVLAAKICPLGLEATLFAGLMSVFNAGGVASGACSPCDATLLLPHTARFLCDETRSVERTLWWCGRAASRAGRQHSAPPLGCAGWQGRWVAL